MKTKYAAAMAAPCTPAPDPTRKQRPENKEPKVHALYGYIYVADKYEGLILVGAGTTIDGNPRNNFLKREVTFNPDGVLDGACGVSPLSATMPMSAATRAWSWCPSTIPRSRR